MRAALPGLLLLSLALFSASIACGATYVISDFESDADLARWTATGAIVHCPDGYCDPMPATLSRQASNATSGTYSCRIRMPAVDFPGMNLSSFPITNWSPYDVLRMDFHNPNGFAVMLRIELADSVGGWDWGKRYVTDRILIPGLNHLEVNLRDLPRNDGSGDIDLTSMYRFMMYGSEFDATTDIYCDYVRLETMDDDPAVDAARNIYKFDCGTGASPRWPDFYRITTSDTYASNPGWGWSGGDTRSSGDHGGPDYLCRDYVRGDVWASGYHMDFRVDLPSGDYTVYVVARSGESHAMPVKNWEIWAEGIREVSVPMDAATFYADDYFYRGKGDDYPLSQSFWDRYVDPQFPAYSFSTTVSDDRLDLRFVNAWTYMFIVYPNSLSGEMTGRIAGWESDRQAQFEATHYVAPPESLTFTPTPAETARGFAAWPVPVLDPCYPDTLPPDPRPALALSAAGCQGEERAVNLAIRPLGNLTNVWVEASDLDDGSGHLVPSSAIDCRYVRYMATVNSEFFQPLFYWKPQVLQSDMPISVPEQVTKQFWLAIEIPDSAVGGTYTGTVTVHTSAGDVAVSLTLEVWPFQLDACDHMSYGWYYTSPNDRYCFREFAEITSGAQTMLRLEFADMKEHGFNAVQFPAPECWPVNPTTGHVDTLIMDELDLLVDAMQDTGFGGLGYDQCLVLSIANQILRHSSVTEFDTNFNAAYKDALTRTVAWGNTDGVPLVMHLVDEPREINIQPQNRNLSDTLAYCGLANQVAGLTSTVSVMADTNNGVDYSSIVDNIDLLCTHPYPAATGIIARARSQSKPIWFYNTWDHEMWTDNRWGDLRMIYGFFQYKHGQGCWEWHYDWLHGSTWDPFPYSPFNDQWHFAYPSPDGPLPTPKYEYCSQGITDYRYAATLERLSHLARASGLTEFITWADQADTLLQSLKDDVPEFPTEAGEYFGGLSLGSSYLSDLEGALDGYRQQIAQLIMNLPGPIPGSDFAVEEASLPTAMEWDSSGSASVTVRNLQTHSWTAPGGHELRAEGAIDRWGLLSTALDSSVLPNQAHQFDFTLAAPPITTLAYQAPVAPADPGVVSSLSCAWVMAENGTPLSGTAAHEDTVISRFPDIQPGQAGEVSRFYIEECAGRVPLVVKGFPNGTYAPTLTVDRQQMAIFMARALKLPLLTYEGRFSDVPSDMVGAEHIEALARADIVQGFAPTVYGPSGIVTREQMAIFVARGMAGGDANVPTGPAVATFNDVPTGAVSYPYVEYCVDQQVVQGYSPTVYGAPVPVSRDQMSIFVWRAFIRPTGTPVVIAGPAATDVDPDTAAYYGWSSVDTDPGCAYLQFDALRLDTNLVYPSTPSSTWDVTVQVRSAADPQGPAVDSATVSLTAANIQNAVAAGAASGDPYLTVSVDLTSLTLPPGDYLLVVLVEDEAGDLHEVGWKPTALSYAGQFFQFTVS